MLTFNIVMRN